MLKQKNRLSRNKDFERVFQEGKKYNFLENGFYIKFCRNGLNISRFGIIVNKKVSKKAVIRNRIKRIIREIIRLNIKEIKKGVDVVIVILPTFKKEKFQKIQETVKRAFQEAKIWKNSSEQIRK